RVRRGKRHQQPTHQFTNSRGHLPCFLGAPQLTRGGVMRKDIGVFGLYPTRTELERAVEALRGAGFRATDVSILVPQDRSTHELGHEMHSKAPEGGVTGAVAGGAVGGVLGWLASVGLLTIPGLGPFLA